MIENNSRRISLIYPPISVKERYGVDIGDIGGRQAPLGVLYLSSYLKKQGHHVQVIDAEAEGLTVADILSRLADFRPEFIGISITTVAFNNAKSLAVDIKKELPGAKLIAGGPHVTANLAEAIRDTGFDYGIYGEGELTLDELLTSSESLDRIDGLIYKDKEQVVVNSPRPYIDDLDSLPSPDRDAVSDIRLYRPPIGCYKEDFVVSIITSRGCPYQCIFCDNNTFGRKIRFFSPEYVVGEIETIISKYGANELTFVDDTFPSKTERFVAIMKLIIERNLKFKWTCMANLNDLTDEKLALMKETGCWQIAVGIESGDDAILKTIKKGLTVEIIKEKVNLIHKHGILAKGFFMLGHPGETLETIEKTRQLALSLPLSDVTCTIATPIKGTEFHRMAASGQFGPFQADADPTQFNYWEPVFTPSALTPEQLYAAQRKFFKSFYLRPGILIRQLKKITSFLVFKRLLVTVFKVVLAKKK